MAPCAAILWLGLSMLPSAERLVPPPSAWLLRSHSTLQTAVSMLSQLGRCPQGGQLPCRDSPHAALGVKGPIPA